MRMRYVSNAGIILETEGKSIGVDCFCKDENGRYYDVAANVKEELLEAVASGRLNTLIFTHEHSDHFSPEYVKEAFEKNRDIKIYGNQAVLTNLSAYGIPKENLIKLCSSQKMEFGDIKVQAIRTAHDGEQYADIEHFTLLINIGRKSIVVTGDANPQKELFEQICQWSQNMDWLLAPFPYVGLSTARKAMKGALDIRHIFVLHQPRKEADVQGWIANTKKVCEQAKDGLPAPVFPEMPGEYYFL